MASQNDVPLSTPFPGIMGIHDGELLKTDIGKEWCQDIKFCLI
jgi:hypothetical protein